MTPPDDSVNGPFGPISRRSAIGSLLAGAAFLTPSSAPAAEAGASQAGPSRTRYDMKKSINLWAFPYPQTDDPASSACSSPRTPASTASS